MKYTTLKGTGLSVSKLCLGTMMFGGQTSEEDSIKIIRYALDHGVNFFDTANGYTNGNSETIIGKALKDCREKAVVATKVGIAMYRNSAGRPVPNGGGLGRTYIRRSVEDSLRRLQTDYIDILYMHFPDPATPMEEAVETMTELVRSGKIRYYGVSNFSAWQIADMIALAEKNHLIAPVVTETVYNPLTRGADDELVPFLRKHNFALAAYNPIAAGLLTGKHSREKAEENTRFALEKGYYFRYWKEGNFDALDALRAIADELGISVLELTFRWHLSLGFEDSAIVGASKLEQVKQNIPMFDLPQLDADTMKKFDAIWAQLKGNYFNYHY